MSGFCCNYTTEDRYSLLIPSLKERKMHRYDLKRNSLENQKTGNPD